MLAKLICIGAISTYIFNAKCKTVSETHCGKYLEKSPLCRQGPRLTWNIQYQVGWGTWLPLWWLLFGCGCNSLVKGRGFNKRALPFYQPTNWPREMSFLSSCSGYRAFMANFLIGHRFSFSPTAATLQHSLPPKCSFGRKLVKSTSIRRQDLKTPSCVQTGKPSTNTGIFWKTQIALNMTLKEIPGVKLVENAAKCQKVC